jgi:hypothetical protein
VYRRLLAALGWGVISSKATSHLIQPAERSTAHSTNLLTLNLFTINTANGAATTVGPLGNVLSGPVDFSALAFNATGTLFATDTARELLLTINKQTAATLTSVSLSVSLGAVAGMAFDPVSGVAYVADGNTGGTNNLYTLNTSTGVLTLVGGTGAAQGLAGLSFSPAAVPEPSTVGLCLVGMLALAAIFKGRQNQRAISFRRSCVKSTNSTSGDLWE